MGSSCHGPSQRRQQRNADHCRFNRRMRKTACPVVWKGCGVQLPSAPSNRRDSTLSVPNLSPARHRAPAPTPNPQTATAYQSSNSPFCPPPTKRTGRAHPSGGTRLCRSQIRPRRVPDPQRQHRIHKQPPPTKGTARGHPSGGTRLRRSQISRRRALNPQRQHPTNKPTPAYHSTPSIL
jgi:hypothetical protein